MNKYKRLIISAAVLMLISCTLLVAQERDKRAQTVMKFLSVTNDARVSAMGDAVTALEGNSASMFFNPAGMARQQNYMSMSLGQTQWIADINYLYGSASFTPFDRKFGVFGLTVATVDYGDIIGTRIQGKSFVETGTFSPTAMTFGVGYAKELTDKFSIGGNVKYVRQSLGSHNVQSQNSQQMVSKDFSANVMAFDLGILYKTGYENLNFGMSIRNFSQEVKFEEENSQLPLTFKLGLSFNFADIMNVNKEDHSLLLAVDAVHPRDYYEQVNVGFEYSFLESFSVRAGYVTPHDVMGVNAGFGMKQEIMGTEIALDYAYTKFKVFDNVHRFTVKFAY